MNKMTLYEKLIEYGKNGRYAFHMPGHKRNGSLLKGLDVLDVDITEIDGFDNLHKANDIIKYSMDRAADFWGTDRTWFLVNGSSCGLLAAINSVTDIGDTIVIGRNSHKAVYNAVALRNLDVKYIFPEYISEFGMNGGYKPDNLEMIFQTNDNVKAVVITSPTYDGVVSDVERLAEITHKYGAVLIVDEAHGAHLGISDELPVPAYKLGADLVIESAHKTLPALTQTAFLHACGERVNQALVEECLAIYESSSPSYVLMASLDKCITDLQSTGKEKIEKLLTINEKFRKNVNKLRYIHIPCEELLNSNAIFDIDKTKLIISVDKKVGNGKQIADLLRDKYNFEMEMATLGYVLGITTICDDETEIERLATSLKDIDEILQRRMIDCNSIEAFGDVELLENEKRFSIYEAKKKDIEVINIEDSCGKISGEFVYLYPPGIPLLVPGEVISERLLQQIREFIGAGMNVCGVSEGIKVLKNY